MGTKEATVAMCKMLLDGFYVGAGVGVAKSDATFFKPLRPDQVVIGVPSSTSAAGSGHISNENLQAAFRELNASYPGMRGIMTWSINWDSSQNGNSFAQQNGAFLRQFRTNESTTTKPNNTTTKPQATTPQVTTPQATTKPSGNTNTSTSTTRFGNDYKVVAYYPNWYGDFTNRVQWDKITHCYYAFGLPSGSGNGTMEAISGPASSMVNACNQHNVVPVLSVGGWYYNSGSGTLCQTVFEQNTNTDAKCQSLAESIVSQAKNAGFKGIDIDWEYPTGSSQAQYTKFMKALRNLCNQNGMILTVAVAATSGSGFTSEVLNILDFVNIMAYDGDNGSGHSPYSLATQSFTYWRDTMGVPAKKLVIGVPFYNRPSWASYADIVAANPANAQTDTANLNGQTVYYNGIPTMKQKAEYAARNAGGIMIWEISQDTDNASLSLLNAIYDTTLSIVGKASDQQQTETVWETTSQNITTRPNDTTTSHAESGADPITPFGLVANAIGDNKINVVWGNSDEIRNLGQTFNVYIDNDLRLSGVECASYDIENVPAGSHTIRVTGVLGSKESQATEVTLTVGGSTIETTPNRPTTNEITTRETTAAVETPEQNTTKKEEPTNPTTQGNNETSHVVIEFPTTTSQGEVTQEPTSNKAGEETTTKTNEEKATDSRF